MQIIYALLVFLLLSSGHAARTGEATSNPLGKVVDLLKDLVTKEIGDKDAEAKAYKDYIEWCDEAARSMSFDIKGAKALKAKLEAKINELISDIEVATSKIEDLGASISTADAELRNATTVREKEAIDFAAGESELMEVADTLSRAFTVIEREMAKNPAAFSQANTQLNTNNMASMLQALGAVVDAAGFSSSDRNRLVALMQNEHEQASDDNDSELGAPASAVYISHGQTIVDLLEDMKEKAEEELSLTRKQEASAQHNFEMLKQSLEDQIKASTKELEKTKSDKAKAQEDKAFAEGDLEVTDKDLDSTQEAWNIATGQCMQVATDHEETQAAFEAEIKVLKQAIELLEEDTQGAVSETYSLMQLKMSSRMQSRVQLAKVKIAELVKKLAKTYHSVALAQLSSRILTVIRYGAIHGEDPFGKVKDLINSLVGKLEEAAAEEAKEKQFCDEMLGKTNARKSELTEDVDKLAAEIDQAVAKSASLKDEVKEFQEELRSIAMTQRQMDQHRSATHEEYVKAKEDLEFGLSQVRKALTLLKDYFASDSENPSEDIQSDMATFMQQPEPPKPATFEKAAGAGGSIIGILEVVESDIAKSLAAEETEEADSQSEYEKVSHENKIATAVKDQAVKYKTQEFKRLDKSITELTSDKDFRSTQLTAVLEYLKQLNDRCIAKPEAYEERKKRRDAEIEGLKAALNTLESETAFMQGKHRGHGHTRVTLKM